MTALFYVVCVFLKLNNEKLSDIELQVADQGNIEKRILYYWGKLYTTGIKEGEN